MHRLPESAALDFAVVGFDPGPPGGLRVCHWLPDVGRHVRVVDVELLDRFEPPCPNDESRLQRVRRFIAFGLEAKRLGFAFAFAGNMAHLARWDDLQRFEHRLDPASVTVFVDKRHRACLRQLRAVEPGC